MNRASPTSQLILQPFRPFTYVTAHSPTFPLLHLRHSSFSNPCFASPTSQALHLIHLASRPWIVIAAFRTRILRYVVGRRINSREYLTQGDYPLNLKQKDPPHAVWQHRPLEHCVSLVQVLTHVFTSLLIGGQGASVCQMVINATMQIIAASFSIFLLSETKL